MKNSWLITGLIALIAGLVFIPFIGNCPLFDWDEVNFAECAREMVVSGDYSHVQLNFRPFWEKPPFFIWLQALSMNIFGVSEFAARFPNAICSIVTLVAMFRIGRRIHSPEFGVTWAAIYAATLLPHLYFKSGLIDPWFNLFIFMSLYHCIQLLNNPDGSVEIRNALAGGLFLGLAVLTKGPAALVIVALTLFVYGLWSRQIKTLFSKYFIIFGATTILVAGSWFLVEFLKGNGKIIEEFIDYQVRLMQTGDSGHGGPFYYHFVVLLVGCFPFSFIFMAAYFRFRDLTPFQRLTRKVMICLFWVVLLLFSIVKTKIIHYSSLCYFPITFVTALGLTQFFSTLRLGKYLSVLYWIIGSTIALLFTAIGLVESFKHLIIGSGIIKDEFAKLNLQASVQWSGFEFLLGPLFLLGAGLIFYGIRRQHRSLVNSGIAANLVFVYLSIAVIIPKVELYSQHAAIEFYKACAKQHCYVETHGFKSYAYLFYSDRHQGDYDNPDQVKYISETLDLLESQGHSRLSSYPMANLFWMESGKIDRPAYIVIKTPDEQELSASPEFRKLYAENGFSFFVRMPVPAK
jgi:4-amino-4-deoxy-L-arabinose transferase-like glycosyltransferase